MSKITVRAMSRVAVVCLLLAAIVAGCAGGKGKASSNELSIYAAEKDEIVQAVLPMWKKAAPEIKTNVMEAGSNEITQRVISEKQHPLGDVVWGSGAEGLASNPEVYMARVNKEEPSIDRRWLDVARGKPWGPNNVVPMVLIYNTKLVPADKAPRGWFDLMDARWKGKLAYADPDKSGSAFTQLACMLTVFGGVNERGWKQVEQVVRNAKILSSSGKVPKGVADGEYAVGLTYENVAYTYVKGGAPIKVVYPREGTAIIPDGNALIRNAPHPEAAARFLDFLVSKPVQEMLAKKLSLRSCRVDIADPPGLPPIDSIKVAPDFEFNQAVFMRKPILGKWRTVLTQLPQ